MEQIYLDYNATTPIAKEVADEMRPYLDQYFGNPSSLHSFGIKSKLAIEKARQQIADLINCDPNEIIFTSGGTESNNLAIKGIAFQNKDKGNHIITSSIEHPAVFEVCKYLKKFGFKITYLPVDNYGMVDPNDIENAITPNTILITIMHANNEVGTIQPIKDISKIAKRNNIFFHTDAAQSLGKVNVDVKEMGIDLLSIAGHKLYAPKGIGALYIKDGIKLEKLMHGADHEQNIRPGTENVLQIVGLGKACELIKENLHEYGMHYKKTRDFLFERLKDSLDDIKLNGHPEKRLPNTLSISFPRVEANTLISRLEDVAASAGAACHAESIDVSVVLEAMKVPITYAMGTIRFSTGRELNLADIKKASNEIIKTVKALNPNKYNPIIDSSKEKESVKLTHYTRGLGCACKFQPQNLEKVLSSIPHYIDPKILVDSDKSDDASVYQISDKLAIVQSLDFFTPIVDDPYDFGAIAAANALSDIYAMGAQPLFAQNIVSFPEDQLPLSILEKILQGANDKAVEAGIGILGGHTVDDNEPKFGMVVTGKVDPEKIIKNHGALPRDLLILTKPLGTGIICTAIKKGLVDKSLQNEVTSLMSTLNKTAAEIMLNYKVNACTDVTGFGLLGHLWELTKGSNCDVEIYFDKLPFIRETKTHAAGGSIPGGSYNNLKFVEKAVDFTNLTNIDKLMVCDAQTSGGLLVALNEDQAEKYLFDLHKSGINRATIIGKMTKKGKGQITINKK